MGEDIVEQICQNSKTKSFTSIRKPAVMTLHIPIMYRANGFTSQEVFLRATRENSFDLQYCLESSHSLSHTTHTMKSHIK